MRFASPDKVSPFGAGGVNAYAYVHNDPINLSDPDGHAAQPGNVFFGKQLEFTKHLKKLQSFDEGYGVYQSRGHLFRKPGLIIHSHGGTNKLHIDSQPLSPHEFSQWLKNKKIKIKDYRKITFATCLTGFSISGERSFAQEFANLNSIRADAYAGIIYSIMAAAPKSKKLTLGVLKVPFRGLFPAPHPNFTRFPRVYSKTRFYPQENERIRSS